MLLIYLCGRCQCLHSLKLHPPIFAPSTFGMRSCVKYTISEVEIHPRLRMTISRMTPFRNCGMKPWNSCLRAHLQISISILTTSLIQMRLKFVTHSVYYLRNPRIPYMYFLEYKAEQRTRHLRIQGIRITSHPPYYSIFIVIFSNCEKKKRREKILGEM